jgi:flagellar M-ring protein FliF
VVIESMPFSAIDAAAAEESIFSNLPLEQIFSVVKLLIIAAVALFVARMLRPRYDRRGLAGEGAQAALGGPEQEQFALNAPDVGDAAMAALPFQEGPSSMLDQEVALAEVDGRVKLSAIKRIGDAVTKSPAEAASVIRQWMAA